MTTPKIFVLINSAEPEWYVGMALAEDGAYLAGHVSSSPEWFRHDMGLLGDRKHDLYRAHYPDGFELVEVAPSEAQSHRGLMAAYQLNQRRDTEPREK